MVKYTHSKNSQIDLIFHSLADPTRRKILERLTQKPLSVTQIANHHYISLPAISKHLKILEKANLISRQKQGRTYTIQLKPDSLQKANQYFSTYKKYWNTQLKNLEIFLNKSNN